MEVEVRGLNTYERTSVFENAKTGVIDADGEARIDSRRLLPAIVIATAHVPETGEALFGAEDEDWLNGKSAMATGLLFGAATELSGISKAEVDRIKKDFDPTPKPAST
jgi:hypothetical protein